jgi:nucleotide-binding universal stress UspA family protein
MDVVTTSTRDAQGNDERRVVGSRVTDRTFAQNREESKMKIVVGYDGSDAAKRALERAATLAGDSGSVVVVAAAESLARTGITEGAHLDPSEVAQRRHDLDEAQELLSARGIDAETIEAQGDPGDVVVEASKDADLVIVGSRGLNPFQRLLLGSVSSKVVHRAERDVLVVR